MQNPQPPKRPRGRPLRGPRYSPGSLFGGHAVVAKQDPYPAVLQRISALLDWGIHAEAVSSYEAGVLAEIGHAARRVLGEYDPHSLHLIPQPEAN